MSVIKELILNFSHHRKSDSYKINSSQILISSDENSDDYIFNSNYMVLPSKEQQVEFSKAWKEVIEIYSNESLIDVIISHESYVYRRVFRPLSIWLNTIDKVIENNKINEVYIDEFYDGDELFLYEAEGEVNRKVLYSSSFYLPVFINNYLSEYHPEIKVRLNRKNRFAKKAFYSARNLAFLSFMALKKFRNSEGISGSNVFSEKKIVASARSLSQADYIANLSSKLEDFIVLTSKQISQKEGNDALLNKKKVDYICVDRYLDKADVIKQLFNTIVSYFSFKSSFLLNYNGLEIPIKYLIKDMIIKSFDYYCLNSSVLSALTKENIKPNLLISCDIFSPHTHFLPSGEKTRKIQLQISSMEPCAEANFIYSDAFYFYSEDIKNKFIKINPELSGKALSIPPTQYYSNRVKDRIKNIKSIVYFSQPVLESEEIDLLKDLKAYCLCKSIRLSIKPHPRQDLSNLSSLDVHLLKKDCVNESVIYENDLVITRTSSIGMDCWIMNAPIIFVRESQIFKNVIAEYIPRNYCGDVGSIRSAFDLIDSCTFLEGYYLTQNENFSSFSELDLEKRLYG